MIQREVEIGGSFANPKELASQLIEALMGTERKLVKRLKQHFEEEGTDCVKAVRLALPITMSKIDWDVNLTKVILSLQQAEKELEDKAS